MYRRSTILPKTIMEIKHDFGQLPASPSCVGQPCLKEWFNILGNVIYYIFAFFHNTVCKCFVLYQNNAMSLCLRKKQKEQYI